MLSPFEERQVLAMQTRDLSVAQMGRELRISPLAVRTFERSILTKLRLHSDLEAVTVGKERKGKDRPEERPVVRAMVGACPGLGACPSRS
jgi:DNA-binding NarL/FixJ family response regulator